MDQYAARPEHWADVAEWVEADSQASTDHCIWELRGTVRMLEEELRNLKDTVSLLISSVDRLETDAYWNKQPLPLITMTKEQIEMLRSIIKQEIEAAGIDGMEHGVWGWAEKQLDENWEEFRKSFEAQ